MNKSIDFTSCRRVFGKAYSGANGKKIAVEYEGRQYMLKFPPSGQQKPTELSYTNSCFSEHIACSIFRMLGVTAQETMLGTFDVAGKIKIVCACRDFTADGKQLFDFCSIKNTILDSDSNGSRTELSDILETIEKQQFIEPGRLLEHFWEMFAIDALLGNFDRHNGNWGFLYDPVLKATGLAPVYDCDSCLLPQADESVMQSVLENEDALNKRVFQFPTSAVKLDGRKINYYDYLMKAENADCNEAVKRIYGRLNMEKIHHFIEGTPYLSDLQKAFYKKYIGARVSLLLAPVHEMILALKSGQTFTV